MSQNGKRDDDMAAYLWKSNDYGESWTDITNNIPYGPLNVIREDPKYKNILYVGTDYGVFVSIDGGNYWQTLNGSFPTTYVQDIIIHPRDNIMVAATHGRGMWAMDVEYIQNLSQEILSDNCYVYDIDDALLPYNQSWWYAFTTRAADIPFYLKEKQEVLISITDKDGNIIFENNITADKGLNFAEWDLYPNMKKNTDNHVVEGSYTFSIKGKDFEKEKSFSVSKFQF